MISMVIFLQVSVIFALKWWHYPQIIRHDFADPIGINLFGVFFISLLNMSAFLYNYDNRLGFVVWVIGTVTISVFFWIVLSRWFGHPQDPQNALPVWPVPLLGVLGVPLTGLRFTSPDIHEICLFFLVTALLFIAILVIFTRLLFQALFFQTFHFIIAEYVVKGCPKPAVRMTYREFIHGSQHR